MHRGPRPIIHPRPMNHRPVSSVGRAVVGAVVVGAIASTLIHPRPVAHHMPPRPHHAHRVVGGPHRR